MNSGRDLVIKRWPDICKTFLASLQQKAFWCFESNPRSKKTWIQYESRRTTKKQKLLKAQEWQMYNRRFHLRMFTLPCHIALTIIPLQESKAFVRIEEIGWGAGFCDTGLPSHSLHIRIFIPVASTYYRIKLEIACFVDIPPLISGFPNSRICHVKRFLNS